MAENTMKLCRLCMYEEKCKDDPNQVFSIFSEELKGINDKIKRCIRLDLKPEDIIPPNVCKNCLECLERYYNFFDKCHKTDETLRSIFNIPCSYSNTSQNVISQLSTNHLSNEGTTESSSTFPNKNSSIIVGASTSIPKHVLDDFLNENDTDSTSSLNTISKRGANANKRGENGQLIFACSQCSEVFSEKKKLLQHNAQHKEPDNICNIKFVSKNSTEHYMGRRSDKYRCVECGVGHTSKAALQRHLRTCRATKAKKFVCQICGMKNVCRSSPRRHTRYHNTLKPRQCKYCDFTSNSVNVLNAHASRKHCVCHVCARWFKSELSLKQHKRRMHNPKKYICNICSHTFVHRDNLRAHIIKKHAKKKAFDCSICGRGFCKAQQLEDHLITHRGRYPQCSSRYNEFFQCSTAQRQSREVPWDARTTRSLPN